MALQHLTTEWLIFFSSLNISVFDGSKKENLLTYSVYPDVKGKCHGHCIFCPILMNISVELFSFFSPEGNISDIFSDLQNS